MKTGLAYAALMLAFATFLGAMFTTLNDVPMDEKRIVTGAFMMALAGITAIVAAALPRDKNS